MCRTMAHAISIFVPLIINSMKIFVSGSISIKTLSEIALAQITDFIEKGHTFLIGDAYGVDLIVQMFLEKNKYPKVFIYFAGLKIRNNHGKWNAINIKALNDEKGRALYVLKDIEMAKDADLGFMIWDGKSKGTLNNIQMMKSQNKKFQVVLNEELLTDRNLENHLSKLTIKQI